VPECSCHAQRDAVVQALGRAGLLSRRDVLRGAAGAGAVVALAGAVPTWASSRDGAGSGKAAAGSWLAGDLHVHTVLSHDVWAGPDDDNTGTDEAYTWGWTGGEQIAIAESRGLDFLALTDHNRTDVLREPDYRSSLLTLIPGYEHSLAGGHAGVFVPSAESLGDVVRDGAGGTGFSGAEGLADFLARVHGQDGIVVLNHPFYKRGSATAPPTWSYDVAASLGVDAVEVWNSVWFNRSEISPQIAYDDPAALPWWEQQFLPERRMPLVGGSDNHWRVLTGIAGVGQPTTWVLAADRSVGAVLAAIRAGRTTVSAQPPAMGGARLEPTVVEDWTGGGAADVGDAVKALGPLVVRTRVRNGTGLTLRLISTGQVVASSPVTGPDVVVEQPVVLPENGWLRLELVAANPGTSMLAMTSPVYTAGKAPAPVRREPSTGPAASYPIAR
jgi:predicted metal-dependent phosphoesterase TrpH